MDSEDDASDIDTEEIKGQLKTMQQALQRHFGHHKDVGRLRSEDTYGFKEFTVITPNLVRETPSATMLAMREELEQERKRRMEQMAESDDEETIETVKAKTGVHEELLHLFAFHDAMHQTDSEKLRAKVEDAKEMMHEELLRRSAQKIADKSCESERERQCEELGKLAMGVAENEMEMVEINENITKVQCDLKNAFKSMTKTKESKNSKIQKKTEDSKEQVLQDIRRKPALSSVKKMTSKEQQRRISEYDERIRSMMSDSSRELLVNVQEQLLGLFSKLKTDKKVSKTMQVNKTAENKALVQEELIRTAASKKVDREANAEKARRMKENLDVDFDISTRETIELLMNVQKQLLDTCSHVQSENLKQNVKQIQFLKARQNVLKDIRKTGEKRRGSVPQETDDMTAFSCAEKGRKLSLIGEQFETKMKS